MLNRKVNILVLFMVSVLQNAMVHGFRMRPGGQSIVAIRRFSRGLSARVEKNAPPAVPYTVAFHESLCGAQCIALQCPSATDHVFNPLDMLSGAQLECLNKRLTDHDCKVVNAELALGMEKELGKAARVNVFMGGRLALRRAIMEARIIEGTSDQHDSAVEMIEPLLSTPHGGPAMPPGYTGSISHKDSIAVAAAMRAGERAANKGYIGVDIEKCANAAHEKLMRRLLTSDEQADITNPSRSTHPGLPPQEDVMLRFSLKEAVYKAVHPYLLRYVEFTEVEVFPEVDGTAVIKFRLRAGEQFEYRAEWRRFGERYWITCVNIWSGPHHECRSRMCPSP